MRRSKRARHMKDIDKNAKVVSTQRARYQEERAFILGVEDGAN